MSGQKRKLNTLSLSDKVKLISEVDKGVKKKKQIASDFGIPSNTLSTILKNREKILKEAENGVANNRKRFKTCTYEDVDEATLKWLKMVRDWIVPISGPLIRETALSFARSLGHADFVASVGWLDKFKKRHNIIMRGESADVSEQWRNNILPGLLAQYEEKDIFNADEIALFYKCLPDTFGGKHSKERITVMLGANMCGTEKLKLLVVGKSKNFFKGKTFLPVTYKSNKNAWMTNEFYEDWLSSLDRKFTAENRKILLFVDPSHLKVSGQFNSIRFVFLPSSSTVQPMHQGIIKNLKMHYRRKMLRQTLLALEDKQTEQINIWDAIRNLSKAWDIDVQQATIKNCFVKAGFNQKSESVWCEEDDTPLLELKLAFNMYLDKTKSNPVSLQEYLSVDDDVAVGSCPTEADILNEIKDRTDADEDALSDNELTSTPPSNKEMRHLLKKCSDYFCSKETVTDEVYRALTTLENFVEDDSFNFEHSKRTDFFKQ